jgi:hypothetical protein
MLYILYQYSNKMDLYDAWSFLARLMLDVYA